VIEEKKGYLGDEYFVVKRDVVVGSSNYTHTGIISGLQFHENVITSSNKPLQDNSQVSIKK